MSVISDIHIQQKFITHLINYCSFSLLFLPGITLTYAVYIKNRPYDLGSVFRIGRILGKTNHKQSENRYIHKIKMED